MIIQPHSAKQERAIFSEKPIVLCATGIQWGKTTVGAIKAKVAAHTFKDPADNFLILAPSYKVMNQSTMPAFMKLMRGLVKLDKFNAEARVHNGGNFYFRTATDPDSIVGITNVRFIWGDEAGLYPLYFWENIQARSSFREAQIVLTTSPYTLNWIYTELIRPKLKDMNARPDVELIRASSNENTFFPEKEFEKKRQTMDERRFNMVYGGNWDRMAGLVYDAFDPAIHVVPAFPLPPGTRFFAGVDWGYTEPFALVIVAVTPDRRHYVVSEFYKSGLTIADIAKVCLLKKQLYGIERFFCDPSQPAAIEHMNREGCPAVKANNDIRPGIDKIYEGFKTGRLKYFEGHVAHLIDETSLYHYPSEDDPGPNKDVKEQKPVMQHDHALDALRYVEMGTSGYTNDFNKRTPKVPEDQEKALTQWQRIKRLTTRSKTRDGENWS